MHVSHPVWSAVIFRNVVFPDLSISIHSLSRDEAVNSLVLSDAVNLIELTSVV